jgi:hypothetical protein
MEYKIFIILFLIVSMILFGVVFNNTSVKQYKFRTIMYAIVFGLLIGLAGILGNKNFLTISHSTLFYILTGWMLLLGFLHVFFMKMILPWTLKKSFGTNLSLSLGIGLLGAGLLLIAFHLSHYSLFVKIHLTSIIVFLVPFLFYSTYLLFLNIPVKVLRKWHYPVDKHVDDPTDREMDSPLVVGFEFKKRAEDENMTTFRAKAPKEMAFGKLFYYFINDYNDRNPDEKIEFLNEKNIPFNWIFYHKPKWFSGIRYIDPEETNAFNFIKENSVIVCKRVIEK